MKSLWIILFTALISTGCIEFEKQTMVFRHYPKADTLVIWQQFEGIYGGEDNKRLDQSEISQLEDVLNGQRTFFFSNWIFEYDADTVKGALEEMQKELEENDPEVPPAIAHPAISLLQLALKHIRVENGNFYLNAKGQLSCTQRVTLTNLSGLLKATNTLLRAYAKDQLAEVEKKRDDPALVRAIRRALVDRMNFITLNGQQLRVAVPMSARMFAEWQKEGDAKEGFELMKKLGIRIRHQGHLATFELGQANARETTAGSTIPNWKYVPNALEHVKTKYGLEDGFNAKHAREQFFRRTDDRYKK